MTVFPRKRRPRKSCDFEFAYCPSRRFRVVEPFRDGEWLFVPLEITSITCGSQKKICLLVFNENSSRWAYASLVRVYFEMHSNLFRNLFSLPSGFWTLFPVRIFPDYLYFVGRCGGNFETKECYYLSFDSAVKFGLPRIARIAAAALSWMCKNTENYHIPSLGIRSNTNHCRVRKLLS